MSRHPNIDERILTHRAVRHGSKSRAIASAPDSHSGKSPLEGLVDTYPAVGMLGEGGWGVGANYHNRNAG